MSALHFTTTQLRGLNAAGRTADLQRSLISAILERHLGKAIAGIFAEFEVKDSDTREWFVDTPPAPTNIRDLPPAYQEALQARCEEWIGAIRSLADKLEAQGGQGGTTARALRTAIVFPQGDLWLYQGAPLIVNWGYFRADAEIASPNAISEDALLPERQQPAETSDNAPRTRSRARIWPFSLLLWAAFTALLCTIYAELLPACGLAIGSLALANGACVSRNIDPAFEDGARLQRQVEQAELALAKARQACVAERKKTGLRQEKNWMYASLGNDGKKESRNLRTYALGRVIE